jgi:hypothetical protein
LHRVGEGHGTAVGEKKDAGLIGVGGCLYPGKADIEKPALLLEVSLLFLWRLIPVWRRRQETLDAARNYDDG